MEEAKKQLQLNDICSGESMKERNDSQFLPQDYNEELQKTSSPSSIKVQKAIKFLLLPEISGLPVDRMKTIFLLSKGFTQNEVHEAFQCYQKKLQETQSYSSELKLHNVNQCDYSPYAVQLQHRNASNGFSFFFGLLRKVITMVGITSAVYLFYQKWLLGRKKESQIVKDQKRIEEELKSIKNELQKLDAELKNQQAFSKIFINVPAEVSLIKTMLASREYFEKKQNSELTFPAWQLKSINEKNAHTDEDSSTKCLKNESSEDDFNLKSDSEEII